MFIFDILHIDLQLFAGEGGAAGGDGGAASGETGNAAGSQGEQSDSSAEGSITQSDTQTADEARMAEFNEMLAKYKDLDDARMQSAIKGRLAENKKELSKLRKENSKAKDILNVIARKYGSDTTDLDSLHDAVIKDDSYYEDEAYETGKTVSEVRTQHENEALKQQIQAFQQQREIAEISQQLQQEAAAVKEIYPSFDFDAEYEGNPDFARLLKNGVQMEAAYYVCHRNEIEQAKTQYLTDRTKKEMASTIIAGKARPQEGGMSQTTAVSTGKSVKDLSLAEMKAIYERVKGGEKITKLF